MPPTETDASGYALLVGKAVTEHVTEILEETNATFEVLQEAGDTYETLLSVATSRQIDLIAIGTHSRNPLQRLLRKSPSYEILHHAPCSALIAR